MLTTFVGITYYLLILVDICYIPTIVGKNQTTNYILKKVQQKLNERRLVRPSEEAL